MGTAEVRYLKINYDEVIRELRSYAKSIARTHKNVRAIVLVGSLAKGNYTGASDADVLVIAENLPPQFLERYAIFADARMSIDVEPHVYSTEEFLKMAREGNHFAVDAMKIGIPLGGEKFFTDLKARVRMGS